MCVGRPLRHPCRRIHSRHASLGTLSGAGASRAELERIIAIDRQALQLARTKLVGLSGREYDEEKKVGHLPCYHTTATHLAHRLDTILCAPGDRPLLVVTLLQYYAFSADSYAHSASTRSLCLIPPCPQVIAGLDATLQAQLARLADVWWGRPLFKSGVANEARR